jgi:Endonuclease/Exonuclease/phosphatase family
VDRVAWIVASVIPAGSRSGSGSVPSGSPPIPDGSRLLRLVAWNIALQDTSPATQVIEALVERAPAIVGLMEVGPGRARALALDAELARHYPYREIRPFTAGGGLVLLSSWPIAVEPEERWFPVLSASVALEDGVLGVSVAHAPNPLTSRGRGAVLERLRGMLLDQAAAGRPAVLLADLNTSDLEPAFRSFVRGLVDVPGAISDRPPRTWGPLPHGPVFLRIDHVIATPGITPVSFAVDGQASDSDHCLLEVQVMVPVAPRSNDGP